MPEQEAAAAAANAAGQGVVTAPEYSYTQVGVFTSDTVEKRIFPENSLMSGSLLATAPVEILFNIPSNTASHLAATIIAFDLKVECGYGAVEDRMAHIADVWPFAKMSLQTEDAQELFNAPNFHVLRKMHMEPRTPPEACRNAGAYSLRAYATAAEALIRSREFPPYNGLNWGIVNTAGGVSVGKGRTSANARGVAHPISHPIYEHLSPGHHNETTKAADAINYVYVRCEFSLGDMFGTFQSYDKIIPSTKMLKFRFSFQPFNYMFVQYLNAGAATANQAVTAVNYENLEIRLMVDRNPVTSASWQQRLRTSGFSMVFPFPTLVTTTTGAQTNATLQITNMVNGLVGSRDRAEVFAVIENRTELGRFGVFGNPLLADGTTNAKRFNSVRFYLGAEPLSDQELTTARADMWSNQAKYFAGTIYPTMKEWQDHCGFFYIPHQSLSHSIALDTKVSDFAISGRPCGGEHAFQIRAEFRGKPTDYEATVYMVTHYQRSLSMAVTPQGPMLVVHP